VHFIQSLKGGACVTAATREICLTPFRERTIYGEASQVGDREVEND